MTDQTKTTYLDLDAVVPDREVVIKLDGNEHKMVPISVEEFVANLQLMERLGTGVLGASEEKNVIVRMLNQAFPTISVDRFNKLKMAQLNTLIEFTREHSGEKKATGDLQEAAATGSPQ